MDLFWNKIMPVAVANYPWSGEFSAEMSPKKWEKNIALKVEKMSEDEFDLFLAAVVMQASKAQMMGVGLTEKITFFRSLRAQ
jgi:hypothetical protein